MKKLYEIPETIREMNSSELKLKHLQNIKRSFFIYRVDTGSCNGCEIEIFATISPVWDPTRLGFKLVASPRHADILLCTGPLTRMMRYPLLRAYEAAPDPKVVIAFGACGCSGGIFHDSYAIWSGIDSHLPVDLYIPGCPPHPATIIHGLGLALGLLDQKLKNTVHTSDDGTPPPVDKPILGNVLFERDVYVESRLLMGYFWGRKLYSKYLNILKQARNPFDSNETGSLIEEAIEKEEDVRFAECIRLLHKNVYIMKWIKK